MRLGVSHTDSCRFTAFGGDFCVSCVSFIPLTIKNGGEKLNICLQIRIEILQM